MGLETGTLIPDLVDANPSGTDPKSEGDDHLRLIKTCVQGSFPAFVGTTAVPASVALSEDEINDAALKSVPQTITDEWTHQANLRLTSLAALRGASVSLALQNGSNFAEFGDDATRTQIKGNTVDLLILGDLVGRVVDPAAGSVLVADIGLTLRKAGWRNPGTVVLGAGNVTLNQTQEGQIYESGNGSRNITVPSMDQYTTMTISFRAVADNILVPDGGVTLEWANGSGSYGTGNRLMSGANVVQLEWRTATNVLLWGNGIS